MEKKKKYNFELKLKFLKFLYRAGVMLPPSNFSPKMDNWGGMTPVNTVLINKL